jgi:hypothetical protein
MYYNKATRGGPFPISARAAETEAIEPLATDTSPVRYPSLLCMPVCLLDPCDCSLAIASVNSFSLLKARYLVQHLPLIVDPTYSSSTQGIPIIV